jgi:RimJ/RimL family protein N-acetyltransferase
MSDLTYRPAQPDDLDLTYRWANDPEVRKASFHSDPISFEMHQAWFYAKLSSANSLILIFLHRSNPAGIVRFELEADRTVIGISIDADSRGKGLGRPMLLQACKHYFSNHQQAVFAYIKKDNSSSIKAFKNAGFRFSCEDEVNGIPCYLYKLESYEQLPE